PLEGVKVGEPIDPAVLRRAEVKLQSDLRKKRPFTLLSSRTVPVAGGSKVVVTVREGVELKVDRVTIEGVSALDEADVVAGAELAASSWRWWKFSWLSDGGRLNPDEYRRDCQKVRDYYRSQGFLAVEVADSDPQKSCVVKDVSGGSGWVDVIIRVKEGRRYSVGAHSLARHRLAAPEPDCTTENLRKVIDQPSLRRGAHPEEVDRLASSQWFNAEAVEVAADKIREYYGQMGYLNTRVDVSRRPNLETGAIDLSFTIEEGQRFTVRALEIQGNTKTRSTVIARELALSPGEVFDLARMRVSEARLRNTQFFEEVRVAPVPTSVPGQSDLRVTVKEGPTGQVSFGAGYSTVEELVGFLEYSEGNFDFSNPDGWWRGGGQKFRLRVSAGNLSNAIEHSFEEPAVWDRDLAAGYSLHRRFTGFRSAAYDVISQGAGVYVRRRVLPTVEARLAYDIRRVQVDNVVATAPASVQAENGNPKTISGLTVSLVHDTRDTLNFPTKGERISLTEELAGNGIGGDVDYLKSELRAGKWFLVSRQAEQTVSLVGRAGFLTGTSASMPFYERFYLGGAYDMRGFDYNRVGQFSTFEGASYEPVGGLTYGYLSAEYTVKVAENFRLAAFYDHGVVNSAEGDLSLSEANSDWGFGARILLGGAVMRLDFGFPIQGTTDPGTGNVINDAGMRFNFSFGTVF
ncbi:MAG: outer membrane protein assembly factor BamA, partial [Opitutia bacterium]